MITTVREVLISLYLFFYRILFNFFKMFPLKNKVVFVASFKDNNVYIYQELQKRQFPGQVVFLCKASCYKSIKKSVSAPVFLIEDKKIFDEIKAAYHLITAKTVIVDNYYGFLAAANFKKNVECIQIWHAAGAIKNFGYLDQTVKAKPKKYQKRISSVYSRFHKVIVGSEKFAEVFEKAFGVKKEQFLPFGFPRTDFFYDTKLHDIKRAKFYEKYPMFRYKKIILYAPTYRPNEEDNRLALDIEKMYEQLNEEFVLLIRMHPSVNLLELEDIRYVDFAFDFSKDSSVNDLLLVTDYLITDYSSIPFEYAILKKPMIFFPYDLEVYKNNPGIWGEYEDIVPGPIAYDTEEIIHYIKDFRFDINKYVDFSTTWNEYSKGNSSETLTKYILKRHMTNNENNYKKVDIYEKAFKKD